MRWTWIDATGESVVVGMRGGLELVHAPGFAFLTLSGRWLWRVTVGEA